MDTLETYIKMSDHPLIQEHRKPTVKRLKSGRDCWEYDFKDGDVFVTYDLFDKERKIETVGTTIYSPDYYGKSKKPTFDVSIIGWDEGDGYPSKVIIWLPRRAQIQEMLDIKNVEDFYNAIFEMFFKSSDGAYYNALPSWKVADYDCEERFSTPEQLWLAYYMHKKHGLTWDGDKWVK